MEWDSKMPPWELPELEQHAREANINSVVGSNGGGGWRQPGLVGGPDCSVDLKLGGWGDSGLAENWNEQRRASTAAAAAAAAAGSSKRPRTPGNSGQNVSCLVDDCKSDLSTCREYHRRHKVCELHSKTPIVMVGGQEQRFCQQCSRFHLLVEFDEVKRSCRKRLDGHNRRRRKPQPETINTGNLFPTHHGSRFTSYPQNFQTAATDTTWTSSVKTEEEALYALLPLPMHFVDSVQQPPPQHFASTFNQSYKEGRQFSFLHDGSNRAHSSRAAVEPGAVCQPLLSTISSAAQSSSNKIMFSDGLPLVLDSDCALSLLSSPTQTSEINLGLMGQPLLSDMHYGGGGGGRYSRPPAASNNSYSAMEEEHVGNVMAQDACGTDVHCQSLFHVGDEGSSDGASEPLPFLWQ